jgi:hypothetical protein
MKVEAVESKEELKPHLAEIVHFPLVKCDAERHNADVKAY